MVTSYPVSRRRAIHRIGRDGILIARVFETRIVRVHIHTAARTGHRRIVPSSTRALHKRYIKTTIFPPPPSPLLPNIRHSNCVWNGQRCVPSQIKPREHHSVLRMWIDVYVIEIRAAFLLGKPRERNTKCKRVNLIGHVYFQSIH